LTAHIEDFKRKRLAGEILQLESEEERSREERLRRDLQESPKSGRPQANAKYGWLGRKRLHQQVTHKTINYEIQCLHTFLHWAIRQNYLFSNPATSVERFRVSNKSLPRFMTSEDLRKFFQICDDEQRRIFSMMLLTGMRKGELENLTWNDVHFELAIIFIQPKEGWNPKSDDRIIPISPVLHQILSEQRERRSSEHWVFANKYGNQSSHLLDKLKMICRRAGIRQATLHRPPALVWISFANGRGQSCRYCGLDGTQGSGYHADLCKSRAAAFAGGCEQADLPYSR
jgi:integrase